MAANRRNYFRMYRVKQAARIKEKRQAWDSNNSDRVRQYTKTQEQKPGYGKKKVARRAAQSHAKNASRVCSSCGGSPKGKDGRSLVQAHHDDYSAGKSYKMLCATCHGKKRMRNG